MPIRPIGKRQGCSDFMRILSVCAVFYPSTIYGGPSSVALAHARSLAERGHDVTVISTDLLSLKPLERQRNSGTKAQGFAIRYFSARVLAPAFPFLYSGSALSWVCANSKQFDVAHIHFARELFPVRIAQCLQKHSIPTVLQTHGMLNSRGPLKNLFDRIVTRPILRHSYAALALQDIEASRLREIYPSARVRICPNGVATESSQPLWTWREDPQPTILFLARLHPRKRVLAFIDMAKLLTDHNQDLRFVVAGPDGGDEPAAQDKVRQYRLGNRFDFLGPISGKDVRGQFAAARLYVLPSVDEPFPMSVLEALATGTPTIVTAGIHIRETLESLGAAVVASPDATSMAARVQNLVHDKAKCEKLSRRGRRAATEFFSMQRVTATLEETYAGAAKPSQN